jgi:hypothetical protein
MDTHMLVYSESEIHRWRYLHHLIGPNLVILSRFHLFFRRSVADIAQFSPQGTPGSHTKCLASYLHPKFFLKRLLPRGMSSALSLSAFLFYTPVIL